MIRSILLLSVVFFAGCLQDKMPETLVTTGFDQGKMDAAIENARSTVDEFITALNSGVGSGFQVKEPITDSNGTEHFWITDVKFTDGKFTGLVGNDPGIVKSVKFGDERVIAKDEITDWLYVKDEKVYGNYTMQVLLESAPKDVKPEPESGG